MSSTRAAGSNAVVRMCQEEVWGTTPADVGQPGGYSVHVIGLKNESLKSTKNNFESDMINSLRCTVGLGDGNKAVEGNIVSDLIPEGLEVFLLHLLGNPNTVDETLVTTGSNPYTHVMKGSPGNFAGLTIEKSFVDIDQHMIYKGCRVNSMAISLVQEGFHEVTFGFIGKSEGIAANPVLSGGTASTKSGFTGYQCVIYTTMNTTTGAVGSYVDIDGGEVTPGTNNWYPLGFVTGGNVNITNNIETDGYVLGSAFRASAQLGKRACSGDFTTFFQDAKLYNLYANGTVCALKFVFDNGLGDVMKVVFPEVKLSGSAPEIATFQGLNMSLNFNAKYNTTATTDVVISLTNTTSAIEAGTEEV